MSVLETYEPKRVFYYFQELCKIPHGSFHTDKVCDYLMDFAAERGLWAARDEANNVIIKKPGTAGYENAPVVMLQGHSDMVCEKTPDSDHDFTKDSLELEVQDGWISAKNTTLGGDDGIAVAYALAILESDSIAHPPLEVVITSEEEVGLLGAKALDTSQLQSRYLINLDSEEEGYLLAGCAGGLVGNTRFMFPLMEMDGTRCTITLDGLKGGHSGSDIHKYRANAVLLMARVLYDLEEQISFDLISMEGGTKDNAIPRICQAELCIANEDISAVTDLLNQLQDTLTKEYTGIEEGVYLHMDVHEEGTMQVIHPTGKAKILFFLMQLPNGVQKISGQMKDLVETSLNLGIFRVNEGVLFAANSIRSLLPTAKQAVSYKVQMLTELLGGDYIEEGSYPSWEYNPDSQLRQLMEQVYEQMYHKPMITQVIHAGLECGIFFEKMPGLDCVSIGPDMEHIHTTEERLSIASVARTWDYLLAVLKEIKK